MEDCRLKPGSRQKVLKCGACHRIYRSRLALVRHMYKHEQPAVFTCSDCGKTFPTKTRLNIHSRVHSGERPFKCLYCPVYFASPFQLKLHHRRHTGEKPYICSSCKKSFSSSSGLQQHVRTHTNKSPFSCSHCSRSFKQMEKLKQHERIHTGVRPYMCDRCPSTFRVKNSLVRHLRIHSGEMVQCKLCPKAFGELYALKKHHRRQHDKFELTSSVNKSVSQDKAVSHDTDFSLAKHVKNSPEILKTNRLNNEEQQVQRSSWQKVQRSSWQKVQKSSWQKVRHVSHLELSKVVAEKLHLAVGHGDMSGVVDEYGWHRIPLSAASGFFNMHLELPASKLLSRNVEPHNENMNKVTAVLNTEQKHGDLPLHQNKKNSLEVEKAFVQKECFISTAGSRLIPPPTSEAAADIYEQKTINVNKADQQGEQAPETSSSREISRPSTIEYFPSLDLLLKYQLCADCDAELFHPSPDPSTQQGQSSRCEYVDSGDSSQFLVSPSPAFTPDCCVQSPACVPRGCQFLQQCHPTNCADCGVIFPRLSSRFCHHNLQQTEAGKQQTFNPGSFCRSQSLHQQCGLHHHHKGNLLHHPDDEDLPTYSSIHQRCNTPSTPQEAQIECLSVHQRCNSLSTPQGALTECPHFSWPSHQFRRFEATTFGKNPNHIQHLLPGSYQQTSLDLTQLQTSSGLTYLQTSSHVTQLQTSGLTQLQTTSGLTHLQTSSGLTQSPASGPTLHQSSFTVNLPSSSSGPCDHKSVSAHAGPSALAFMQPFLEEKHPPQTRLQESVQSHEQTPQQQDCVKSNQLYMSQLESVKSNEPCISQFKSVKSNAPCVFQFKSVKLNEPCIPQYESVKSNEPCIPQSECLKSNCHFSHEHCPMRSNHPLLHDHELMPSNQQMLQQPNQHQPAETTELESLLCKMCLPVGSATVADISTCQAFTLSNAVPHGNSVGTFSHLKSNVFHHKPSCAMLPDSPGESSSGQLWNTCPNIQQQHSTFHRHALTPSSSEDVQSVSTDMSILSGQGHTSIRGQQQLGSAVSAITDNLDLPNTAMDTSIIRNEHSRNVFISCELVQPSSSGSGNLSLMAHLPALEHMVPSDTQHTGAAVLSLQECSNTQHTGAAVLSLQECSNTQHTGAAVLSLQECSNTRHTGTAVVSLHEYSNTHAVCSHTKEVSSNVRENCSDTIKVCSNSETLSLNVQKHCSDTLKVCSNTQEVSSDVQEYSSDIQKDCSEIHQRELVVQQAKNCSLVAHRSTTKSSNLRTSNRSTTKSGNVGTNNRSATKSRNLRASIDMQVGLCKLPGSLAVNNRSLRSDCVWKYRNISDNVSSCGRERGKVEIRVSENRASPGVRSESVNRGGVRSNSVNRAGVRSNSVNHTGVRSKSVNLGGVRSKSVNRAGVRSNSVNRAGLRVDRRSPCHAAVVCRKQRSQDGSLHLSQETSSSCPVSPAHRDVCSHTLQEQLSQTRTARICPSGESERTEGTKKDTVCFDALKQQLSKAMRRSKRSTSVSERRETSECVDKFGESVGDSCQPLAVVSARAAASFEASAEKACQSGQVQEHCQACSHKSDRLQCATDDNQASQVHNHKLNRHGVKHECSTCSKQFPSRYRLQRHVKTHAARKPHPCHLCARVFPTEKYLDNHLRRHNKQPAIFSCQDCGKIFGRKYQLKIHMRTHSGEKPYKCPQCSHHFATSFQVKLHERVHSDVQPYQCQHCGKRFRSNANLALHVRRHTNDRPYLCVTCGAAFYEASKLTAHVRVHTGVQPFMCDQCPKTFKVQHLLVRHSRWHTGDTFNCEHCNKQFDERWILRAHVARRHSGK